VYLFNKLIVECKVKVLAKLHGLSDTPFKKYHNEILTFGHAAGANVTLNGGNPVILPDATWSTIGGDQLWLVMAWFFYSIAILFEILLIVVFFARGHGVRSFQDGAYVHFTWRLPRELWYRFLVAMMTLVPVLMPALWFFQIFYDLVYMSRVFWVNLEVLFEEWFTGVGLIFALFKLGTFRFVGCRLRSAPQYWHVRRASDSIKNVMLRRPIPEGLFQSNEGFGARLEDALWCAEHGDITKLELCLEDPMEAENVFECCRKDQRIECEERLEAEKLRWARIDATSTEETDVSSDETDPEAAASTWLRPL
jgi:hypothetical protein